ncbi:MAG TPA: hypothetical protein VEX38_01890, partial [Fimbriimonadaceae bacterium]|nr:hypothetical protein [Fimbriimonadaceae bacterium]
GLPVMFSLALALCAFAADPETVLVPQQHGHTGPTTTQNSQVDKIDDVLTVEWNEKRIQVSPHVITFTGGVRALYGPTVLTADKLTLYLDPDARYGIAEGNVHVEDPDGRVDASYLKFDWRNRTGQGRDVQVEAGGLLLRAGGIEMGQKLWELTEVYATPCDEGTPLFALRSPRVTVTPGQGGVARSAQLSLLGNRIVTLKQYRFSFTRRGGGALRLPSPSFSNGRFGIAWNNEVALTRGTTIYGGFRAKQREKTSANLEVTRNLMAGDSIVGAPPPRSDLEERFGFGYFDNIYIQRPSDERDLIGFRRSTISVGAGWNQGAAARRVDTVFTKPVEGVYQVGALSNGLAFDGQVRLQSIRAFDGPTQLRALVNSNILLPALDFGSGLYTHVRLSGTGYLNKGGTFGWGAAQAGLVFKASRQLRLGASLVRGFETGTPAFEADRLYSTNALHLRTDIDFGATKLNLLGKYDFDRRSWYDYEIAVTQAAGCVEPFVAYRRFPSTLTFGLRLRIDDFLELINRRGRKQPVGPAEDREP